MSFNDGFSSRGIDSISGSDGEILTRVAGQWVAAPNMGSGGSFSGVTLDPLNSNLEGHGTVLEPLKVKSNLNVTSVTSSFNGDGSQLTNLSTSVDHVFYVAHDGDDNHVGSLTDPFRTISGAIAQASIKYPNTNESVLIEVRPGSYLEDLSITRPNIYIRGAAVRPEQRSVQIGGKTKVNVSAGDKYNSTVAFQGVFFNRSDAVNPTVNLSASTNLVYFKDCYFASNGSNALKIEGVTTSSAKVVVSECIFWSGIGGTDIIDVSGGDVKIDTAEVYFTSTATGNGNGIKQSGNSLVMADRILVDLNNNITGSAFLNQSTNFNPANPRPTLYISNASINTSNASANGTIFSSNITFLWNILFTNSTKIKGTGPIATAIYSDLTTFNGLSFETINQTRLRDYVGHISGSSFTGSIYGTTAQFTDITASNITASDVITNYINFKHNTDPAWDNGRLWYNNSTHELNYWTEVSNFNVKLGQQLVQRCQNDEGVLLAKGTVVHLSGTTSSDTPRIKKADWSNDNLSANTLGLVAENISPGSAGYVIVQGILKGIDTGEYNPGQVLYLSSSGQFSSTKPVAPKHTVSIGQVVRKQNENGSIYVSIQNGYELAELHDVSSSNELNNDLLIWDSSVPAWKNSKNLGSYTFNGNQTITGSLFIDTSISASQITGSFSGDGSGITNIPSSFSLTTDGTTGSATLVGSTLNIPKYIGLVPPLSATEIFRGTTYRNNSLTTDTYGGVTIFTSGTGTSQAVSNTNYQSKQVRIKYIASVVSTGRYTGARDSAIWYLGGGFRYVCGFGVTDTSYGSGCRQFYGMSTSSADLTYNDTVTVDSLLNLFGVGSDAADTNLQIIHNNGSATATKIDLGSNFPANRTSGAAMTTMYYVELYNPPNSSNVYYKVTNGELNISTEGVITTNIPSTTVALNCFASRCMGGPITGTGEFCLTRFGVYSA